MPYNVPSSKSIEVALKSCFKMCDDRFENLQEAKIISHIPISFELRFDLSSDEMDYMQAKQLKYFSSVLHDPTIENISDLPRENNLLSILQDIFNFEEITDEIFFRLKEGQLFLTENGMIVDSTQKLIFEKSLNVENENRICFDEPLMKFTKYFTFRPKNANSINYKNLCEEVKMNVSKDERLKIASVKYKTKVKSLPFWDNDLNEGLLASYDRIEEETVRDLNYIGLKQIAIEPIESLKQWPDLLMENKQTLMGVKYYLQNIDSFYTNLAFVSNFGSRGHRFVFCNNPNIIGLTFPSESILKSKAKKSYMIIHINSRYSCQEEEILGCKSDQSIIESIFNPLGQKYHTYVTKDKVVRLSFGKCESSKTLAARVSTYEKFISLFGCVYSLLKKHSKLDEKDIIDSVIIRCMFLASNVNINNSSLLDNLRYLVNNSLADFSAASSFIVDKLQIPCKNLFQVKLMDLTKRLLLVANEDSNTIKVSKTAVDEEGNPIEESVRVVEAKISSFLNPNLKYNCPDALLQEVIACFFCTSKGLHDPTHNIKDIHKTPLEIQSKLNALKKERTGNEDSFDLLCNDLYDLQRHQFNSDVVVASTLCAQRDLLMPSDLVRAEIKKSSGCEDSVFQIKTMTSTRSTVIEKTRHKASKDKTNIYHFYRSKFDNWTEEESKKLQRLQKLVEDVVGMNNRKVRNKNWDNNFYMILKDFSEEKREYIHETLKYDKKNNVVIITEINEKEDVNGDILCPSDDKVVVSAVVNSELLSRFLGVSKSFKDMRNLQQEELQLGKISRTELLKHEGSILVGIRPKMQRTQKDREIYVLNMHGKFVLYPLEHTYKSISKHHPFEKISVPGDEKIIEMKRQVDDMMSWIRFNNRKESNRSKNLVVQHYNLDFSKWSPKDNTLKYIWVVAATYSLKYEEKLYMIAALCRHYEKKIFLDHELIAGSKKSCQELRKSEVEYECIFEKMTKGFSTAYIDIKENWLQGQLNYMSSFLHSGAMGLWNRCLDREYGNDDFKTYSNTHSDDNQSSIAVFTDLNEESVMVRSMGYIHSIMKLCTFEPSIKKNFISKYQKEFISQMNVGGQQKSFWVKPVMSMVSGLPYTTLKDDYSSVYSKMSEAISKDAPNESVEYCMTHILNGIDKIYGVRSYKSGNKISQKLEIPIGMLPMCLGGRTTKCFSTIGVLGPRIVDKINLKP